MVSFHLPTIQTLGNLYAPLCVSFGMFAPVYQLHSEKTAKYLNKEN